MSDKWESIVVQLPIAEAAKLRELLAVYFGFGETDWCELTRSKDKAIGSYGPCPVPGEPEISLIPCHDDWFNPTADETPTSPRSSDSDRQP